MSLANHSPKALLINLACLLAPKLILAAIWTSESLIIRDLTVESITSNQAPDGWRPVAHSIN